MKKEKIVIACITILILIAIIFAFIFSNSEKVPPKILVKNDDGKTIEAVLFGYHWKVFGKDVVADAVNPFEFDYPSYNTILSKTLGSISIATSEKFSVSYVRFCSAGETSFQDATYRMNDTLNTLIVDLPRVEGNYVYSFQLEYGKGKAEYGVKVVVTDDIVYEVEDVISYKNTSITDLSNVNKILQSIPYANEVEGIMIDETGKNINVKYNLTSIEKTELLNNTVALFVLIPELNTITYELNTGKVDNKILYSREELNQFYGRDINDYAENVESWSREVIFKEKKQNTSEMTQVYKTLVLEALSQVSKEDMGEYLAINTGDTLNEFERRELMSALGEDYLNIVMTTQEENDKNAVLIVIRPREEMNHVYDVTLTTAKKNQIVKTYEAKVEDSNILVQEYTSVSTLTEDSIEEPLEEPITEE